MSQENVEVVRQAMEAIQRRDRTTYLALHDDDFEVVPIRDFAEAGVRGPDAAWDFYVAVTVTTVAVAVLGPAPLASGRWPVPSGAAPGRTHGGFS